MEKALVLRCAVSSAYHTHVYNKPAEISILVQSAGVSRAGIPDWIGAVGAVGADRGCISSCWGSCWRRAHEPHHFSLHHYGQVKTSFLRGNKCFAFVFGFGFFPDLVLKSWAKFCSVELLPLGEEPRWRIKIMSPTCWVVMSGSWHLSRCLTPVCCEAGIVRFVLPRGHLTFNHVFRAC